MRIKLYKYCCLIFFVWCSLGTALIGFAVIWNSTLRELHNITYNFFFWRVNFFIVFLFVILIRKRTCIYLTPLIAGQKGSVAWTCLLYYNKVCICCCIHKRIHNIFSRHLHGRKGRNHHERLVQDLPYLGQYVCNALLWMSAQSETGEHTSELTCTAIAARQVHIYFYMPYNTT